MATAGATRIPILELSAVTEIPTATKMAVFGDPDGNGIRLLGYMDMGAGFLPLSGGTMTGDIIMNNVYPFNIGYNATLDDSGVYVETDLDIVFISGNGFTRRNKVTGITTNFTSDDSYFLVADGGNTDFKGIIGNNFFDKLNDPLAFAQLGDIGTGFESGYTTTDQVIPATTDTIITLSGASFESDGGLNLIDGTSGKITPLLQGDIIDIDIAMPLLTPSGTNEYCNMTLVPFGTTNVYRAITHQFIKGAGNQDYIAANWTVPIGADIITSGGLSIVINSTAGITIDRKYISVSRIHRAKTTP